MSKLRDQRRITGLCIHCGKKRSKNSKSSCNKCNERRAAAQKRRASKAPNYNKEYRQRIKAEVINEYGGSCRCCGEDNIEFLTIDHIWGDGGKERKLLYGSQSGNSYSFYLKLRRENYPCKYQCLCWNCNLAKHIYGQCPHAKQKQNIVSEFSIQA